MQAGQALLHYHLVEKIGEGGMGVVWKARDTSLDREVAIKVLPEIFLRDAERLTRFQREAKVLASLEHPNIAAVYGFHEAEGQRFLAMEMVGGEDLQERLRRGPVPVDEAVEIMSQVASALEVAHGSGVVHRDLKPANIRIAPDGRVRVLDFGLAKAIDAGPVSDLSPTMSPTVTSAGTAAGVILGTASYMSPEQARGKSLDRRTDVWSFGCVLYELLTGLSPFKGETITDILAAIVHKEPDWSVLPPGTPPGVRSVVERCLRKKMKDRLRDMGDVGLLLQEAGAAGEAAVVAKEGTSRAGLSPVGVVLAAAALIAGAAAAWLLKPAPAPPAAPGMRFEIMLPQNTRFSSTYNRVVTISPDGRTLAYVSEGIQIRALDDTRPLIVPDSLHARSPAFSADGRQLAFWESGFIKRAQLDGSPPIAVGELHERPMGMHWSEDGFIYVGRADQGIWRVPGAGGTPEPFLEVGGGEFAHGPELLPGGEWVLFTLARSVRAWSDASIVAQSLASGERKVLVQRGREARYALSGHLTWVQDGTLFAAPFDLDRMEVTQTAVAVETDITISSSDETGAAGYDLSDSGTLVFAPPAGRGSKVSRLAFLDGEGNVDLLPVDARRFAEAKISPDGTRVAAEIVELEGTHIWILAVDRGGVQRLTTTGRNTSPVWSHDVRYVYFASDRDGEIDIWRRAADLSGPAEQVLDADGAQTPESASSDGRWLLFSRVAPGNSDVGRVSLDGNATVEMLVQTPADELEASFSPDGRFFCFQSDETDRWDVHVAEIATGRRWIVSSDGSGYLPMWSGDGRKILFAGGGQRVFAVKVSTAPQFTSGDPELAFQLVTGMQDDFFDVSRDGGRALVGDISAAVDEDAETRPRVTVVLNWFDVLTQRAGGSP